MKPNVWGLFGLYISVIGRYVELLVDGVLIGIQSFIMVSAIVHVFSNMQIKNSIYNASWIVNFMLIVFDWVKPELSFWTAFWII